MTNSQESRELEGKEEREKVDLRGELEARLQHRTHGSFASLERNSIF
jgi:hypothetical protein